MKFICFNTMTEKGLTKKVNEFLQENQYIEIIKFDYEVGTSGYGVGILYNETKSM
ncbi:hypothetical protein [Staphylococcus edaphicus]|uniref:Uncharacterized protein n=1 Tax=Staphylococcus edaphicus TaxID=1955013 RepID=A0ABY4QDH4_9STAP|nr:hypothetical protein [Staphylococcus edaphicus]UQW81452.1 hypothetical protein MNY58_12985 [Staphylococcus edaphicus]